MQILLCMLNFRLVSLCFVDTLINIFSPIFTADIKAKNNLLTCDMSVQKLLQVLEKDTFQNGSHLDYYDV